MLQVKAMFFQAAKHLFDPHPALVIFQGHTQSGQIGGQAPGFLFADLPMHQQVDRINLLDRQTAASQPDTLTGFLNITAEGFPTASFVEPNTGIGFLEQDVEPTPLVQLAQGRYTAKFAVSDQKNGRSQRDQSAYIGQQSQLLTGAAVSFDVFDPSPGNRNGSFPVRQADDQQLMPEANLGAIHDQTDFSQKTKLRLQPLPSDGVIPFPHSNGRGVQQPAQTPGDAQELHRNGYLPGDAARTHRTALVKTNEQPKKIAYLGDPLGWSQFLNSSNPCII